jgi:beta-lactamase regulating signal transducer with metallopeptidase domain
MIAMIVKATVALLVALALVTLARRSRASLRHLMLAAAFAFLLLLPVVQQLAPSVNIEVQEETVQRVTGALAAPLTVPITRPLIRPSATLSPDSGRGVRNVYLGVCALLLMHLAIGIVRLRRLAAKASVWLEGTTRMNELAHAEHIRRAALVVLSRDVASPLTFGATIVLPQEATTWNDDALTHALRHELEHVRRNDWLLQLAARVVCAIYWFHPLVWIAWRRFCLEAERACDDAVIDSCAPDAYATQLVTLARSMRSPRAVPALAMAARSRLAQRIDAILDSTQVRGRSSASSAMAVLAVLFALLISVAPARLIAAATAPILPAIALHDEEEENPNLAEALVKAAEAGDAQDVKRLLDSGVDVNAIALGDGTALIGAARGGQGHLIDFLIREGADPNLAAPGDGSPLIAAAREGYAEIVLQLLQSGAKIDMQVTGDENALMQAAWHGHVEAVRVLIEQGADVNSRAWEQGQLRTPLRLARRGKHEDVVRMLIEAGARE